MEKINRNKFVVDLETLKGCFTCTSLNIDTEEIHQYVLHPERFELKELIEHLKITTGQITFNGLSFDYPILHHILLMYDDYTWHKSQYWSKTDIIYDIYKKAQSLIEQQTNSKFGGFFGIKESEMFINQLDLFKIHHFNNPARSTGLKALAIAINYPNVMDMPLDHSVDQISLSQVDQILEYNLLDVLVTYEFYKLSADKIQLRKDLSKQYNINCMNYPDSKIGESLILKLYCEKTKQNPWDVKKLRTERSYISLINCIPDYIRFKSKEFNELLDYLKSKTISETKGSIEKSVIFKGFKYDYGTGGLHGACKSGIYESTNTHIIFDVDVASMYPTIGVVNKLFPEHLGIEFCEIYNNILTQRIAAKARKDMSVSDGLKLSLNSVYGKSNDKHSFLFDSFYTMSTTLVGQLILTMLCEKLCIEIDDIKILQINTDGTTFIVKKDQIDKVYSICKQWEKLTNMTLEYVEYSKMIVKDVNNYVSVTYDNKVKRKGLFDINPELHKDPSFKIIPIALSEYFINNTPVEETILNHKNIYDFCGRQKFKSNSYGSTYELIANDIYEIKQQKNVRYYISKKGHKFIKHFTDGRQSIINEGCRVIIFNKYIEKEDYNIDYDYYIRKTNEEIRNIISNQLSLF